jgi:hypothetical protein
MDLEPDVAEVRKAKLRLRWGRRVALSAGPTFKLRHPKVV